MNNHPAAHVTDDTIIIVDDFATLPLQAFFVQHGLNDEGRENIMRALAKTGTFQGTIRSTQCKLTLLAEKVFAFQEAEVRRSACTFRKTKRSAESASPLQSGKLRGAK